MKPSTLKLLVLLATPIGGELARAYNLENRD